MTGSGQAIGLLTVERWAAAAAGAVSWRVVSHMSPVLLSKGLLEPGVDGGARPCGPALVARQSIRGAQRPGGAAPLRVIIRMWLPTAEAIVPSRTNAPRRIPGPEP